MLLQLAIGDAYGAGFEYVDPDFVARNNNGTQYAKHPRHIAKTGGYYTDDTQMSLAIAEAIVSGEPWTPENLAQRFVDVFQRDSRQGYAQGFYHFLVKTRSGAEFVANIRPDSDKERRGDASRAGRCLPNRSGSDRPLYLQAKLTHDTPDGIAAANAAALLSHYFLYDLGPKAKVGKFLEQKVPTHRWADPWIGKVGSKGWMSVRAAVTVVMACNRMSDLLRRCVAFHGDVDTVATIALAAAAHSREVTQDIPETLVRGLENGAYGRDYIVVLDRQLMEIKEGKANGGT